MKIKKIKRRTQHFSLRFLWPLIPAVLLISLVIFLSRSRFFTIKKISCQLQQHPCPPEFNSALISLYHQNLFRLTDQHVQSLFQSLDPTITDINVSKHLPGSLHIDLQRRLAIAQIGSAPDLDFTGLDSTQSASLSAQVQAPFLHLDRSGTIFSSSDKSAPDLPLLIAPSSLSLETGSQPVTQQLADLVVALQSYYVTFESLAWLNPDTAVVKLIPSAYAIINLNQPFNSQVASLQYILSNSKMEEKIPAKIDLRFDKPVLTY